MSMLAPEALRLQEFLCKPFYAGIFCGESKELALRQVAFGMPTSARVASACLFSDDSDT